MRSVLIFVTVYCILLKNKLTCSVVLQSVFFVAALIKSGIFADKQTQKRNSVTLRSVILGAIIIICGFALSAVLTLYSSGRKLPSFILLSFLTLSLYFCFYPLLLLMYQHGKEAKKLRFTTLICTVFPTISSISDLSKLSLLLSLILLLVGSLLLYITLSQAKKGCPKTPFK